MAQGNVNIVIKAKNLAGAALKGLQTQFGRVQKSAYAVRAAVLSVQGAIATMGLSIGASVITGGLFKINKETSRLVAQLRTLEGSWEGARAVFNQLTEFAEKTPFAVDELTEAYIRLRTAGLQPTEDMMVAFGDLASARGKSMLDLAMAVEDAVVGEMERLKEFGITARQESDSIAFTFNGTTQVVAKNAQAVSDYLQSLGDNELVKGGMANQMETLEGATSNLMDAIEGLARGIGEDGVTGMMVTSIRRVTEFIEEMQTAGTEANKAWLGWQDLIKGMAIVIGAVLVPVWQTIQKTAWEIGMLVNLVQDWGVQIAGFFQKLPNRFIGVFAVGLRKLGVFVGAIQGLMRRVGIDVGPGWEGRLNAAAAKIESGQFTRDMENAGIDAKTRERQDRIWGRDQIGRTGPMSWGGNGSGGGTNVGPTATEQKRLQDEIGNRAANVAVTRSVGLEEEARREFLANKAKRDALTAELDLRQKIVNLQRETPQSNFLTNFATSISRAVGEAQTLNQVIADLTTDTIRGFGAAIEDAFAAMVDGSQDAGQAFASAMLNALGAVASGFGDFFLAKAVAAFADGILGDPRGFAAGAQYTAAATAMYALSGALAGSASRVGAASTAADRTEDMASPERQATLVIEGGLLDMSDPRQAEALAQAIGNLSGRRVTVRGGA